MLLQEAKVWVYQYPFLHLRWYNIYVDTTETSSDVTRRHKCESQFVNFLNSL